MSVKGVQITKRDIDVFRLLQQFPLRSAEHIHKHCFGDTKYSAVGRRLKKLVEYKLIKRVTVTGEGYYRYYIGESVRVYLENDKSLKRINHNLLKHDSELYDCLLDTKNAFGDKAEIIPDFQLRTFAKRGYRVTLQYKGSLMAFELSFLPDGLMLYNETAYFIEWDRATLMGVNLFKKVSAYQQYFSEKAMLRVEGREFADVRVVFICPSETRTGAITKAFNEHTTIQNTRIVNSIDWFDSLRSIAL